MDGEKRDVDFGPYGFGPNRTLQDYEKYAGVSFKKRAVQRYTLENNLAPNPVIEDPEEYDKSFLSIFKHCIDVGYDRVPEKDYDFWVVAFHGANDETLYRKDADKNEIKMMLNDPDKYCKIWREFNCEQKPTHWVVWPHSESKGWCKRLTGNL